MSMDFHNKGALLSRTLKADIAEMVRGMVSSINLTIATQLNGARVTDQHRTLNFQGAGVTVSSDPINRRTNVLISGSPNSSGTTNITSAAGGEKTFPLGSAPANWFTTGFNDSAWTASVTQTNPTESTFYVQVPGSTWITDTTLNGDRGTGVPAQILVRRTFTLATGTVTGATLLINLDDSLGSSSGGAGSELYLNGTLIGPVARSGSPIGYATITVPVSLLVTGGGNNVLAINTYSVGGAVCVSYQLQVQLTTGGTDSQYELVAHKGVANGYAGLDSGTHVPTAELGSGTASSSTFLRGDQTWSAASTNSVLVQEVDGVPAVTATTIIFPNTTLTDNGGGSVTYTPASTVGPTSLGSGSVTTDQTNISLAANTWTDLGWSSLTFSVSAGIALVRVETLGALRFGGAVSFLSIRAVMDGTAGAVAMGFTNEVNGDTPCASLAGAFSYFSLTAGSHTFKLQAQSDVAVTVQMKPVTLTFTNAYSVQAIGQ